MPGSNPQGKAEILKFVIANKDIRTIVDFGAGAGTYGHLLKGTMNWLRMIAVEIWEPYIKKFNLSELYDEVICADIRTANLPLADLAILGDIIEHFPKEEAKAVFRRIDEAYRHVVLSMPPVDALHGPECGNPHEAHRSLWTVAEIFDMVGEKYKIRIYEEPLVVCIK